VTTAEVAFARFRQLPQLSQREFAGEVLVLNPDRDDVEHLQATAVHIWRMLDAPRTLPGLVAVLAHEYKIPESDIAKDVEALLDDLITRDLVEEVTEFDG
jgi:hypothetical protein